MSQQHRTAIVTGAAGFLGRYIARELSAAGWRVAGIDSAALAPQDVPLLEYCPLSLPSPQLTSLIRRWLPQLCVHCAGRASVPESMKNPIADYRSGPVVTFEILDSLRKGCKTCKFLFLSSAAVYGNPTHIPVDEMVAPKPVSPYGFHKLQSESLCQEFFEIYGLPTASIRIFSAYGEGLRRQVIWDICNKALSLGTLRLQGTGLESRDFIHASDIAKAICVVSKAAPMEGEVYNVGAGIETTIRDLAKQVLAALGLTSPLDFAGTLPAGTPLNWCADISRIRGLGFSPSVTIEEGVIGYARWCRLQEAQ